MGCWAPRHFDNGQSVAEPGGRAHQHALCLISMLARNSTENRQERPEPKEVFPEFPAPMAVRPALVSGELESGFLPSWIHCPLPLSHRPPLCPGPTLQPPSFLATSPLPLPTGLSKSPISLLTRVENYKFKCSAKGAGGSVGR